MASDGSTASDTDGVSAKKVSDVWDFYQKIDDRKKKSSLIFVTKNSHI